MADKKRPRGRPKGRRTSYTYVNKTTMYWKTVGGVDVKEIVEKYCKDNGIGRVNEFIMLAIYEKLVREGYIKRGR